MNMPAPAASPTSPRWTELDGLRRRSELSPSRALREFSPPALRLWPLYFAALAFSSFANIQFARELLPWNLAFATNVQIYRRDV